MPASTSKRNVSSGQAKDYGRGVWNRILSRPYLYNVLLIAVVILIFSLVSYMVMSFSTRHGMAREVPDFLGLKIDDARSYAHRNSLEIIVTDSLYVPAYPAGIVLDQLPKSGVSVKDGRKIYVSINSFTKKRVPVPYVAGQSLRQAKNMLEGAGLEIKELVYVEDIATNYVLAQYYNGKEIGEATRMEVEAGSGLTLKVGVCEGYATVPVVVGRNLFEAKSRLWECGINIGTVTMDSGINMLNKNDAKVYWQSVAAQRGVRYGARVDLKLTLDEKKLTSGRKEHEALMKQAWEPDSTLLNLHGQPSLTEQEQDNPAPQPVHEDEFF